MASSGKEASSRLIADSLTVMGLEKNLADISRDALVKQYRKLALELHPDKNHGPEAAEAFKQMSAAYQFLLEEKLKQPLPALSSSSSSPASSSGTQSSTSYQTDEEYLFPTEMFEKKTLNVAKSMGLECMRSDQILRHIRSARGENSLAPEIYKALLVSRHPDSQLYRPGTTEIHQAQQAGFFGIHSLYFDHKLYMYMGYESAFIFDNLQFKEAPIILNLGLLRACSLYVEYEASRQIDTLHRHLSRYIHHEILLKFDPLFEHMHLEKTPAFNLFDNETVAFVYGIQCCNNHSMVADRLNKARDSGNEVEFSLIKNVIIELIKNASHEKRREIAHTYKDVLNTHFSGFSRMKGGDTPHWKAAEGALAQGPTLENKVQCLTWNGEEGSGKDNNASSKCVLM